MNFNFKTWIKTGILKKYFQKSPCMIKRDDNMRKLNEKLCC